MKRFLVAAGLAFTVYSVGEYTGSTTVTVSPGFRACTYAVLVDGKIPTDGRYALTITYRDAVACPKRLNISVDDEAKRDIPEAPRG